MSHLSDKLILSTKECHTICGTEAIFEEIEALYGASLLKPFRTMPNNSRSWSTDVVKAAIITAQRSGALSDRPTVDDAVEKLRESKRRRAAASVKARDTSPLCGG